MENKTDTKSTIINYGLILAVASILISLVEYAMGMHLEQNWIIGSLGVILMVIIIVLAIKKYKQLNNSFISWGQAVKIGVGVAVLSALIGSIYNYIFMNFIEPDFMNQVLEVQNQKLLDQGYSEEQIEATNEMGAAFRNPLMMAAFGIIGSAIGGFIVSAIAGAIMQKKEEGNY